MALADDYFKAQRVFADLQDKIGDALEAAGINYADFSTDHYDCSIELYGVFELTKQEQDAIWGIGFYRCWAHSSETEKIKATEKYYARAAEKSET